MVATSPLASPAVSSFNKSEPGRRTASFRGSCDDVIASLSLLGGRADKIKKMAGDLRGGRSFSGLSPNICCKAAVCLDSRNGAPRQGRIEADL